MTTSGTISGQLTVSSVVTAAMQELGLLSAGENPTGEETELAIRSLDWMLKSWAAAGANLWRETDGTVIFAADTKTMTLEPYCLDVEEARLVQATNYERPLQRWEKGQYSGLPNKATPGFPSIYVITKMTGAVQMTVWPVPSVSCTILYTYVRVTEDVTDGAQTIDIPQEWTEAVYLGLAARLCQPFGVTRTDPSTAQIVAGRSQALELALLDQDRPASIYMGATSERYF